MTIRTRLAPHKIWLAFICLLVLYYTMQGLLQSGNLRQAPQVRDGVLDLTGWDFEQQGTVRLDGLWQLYWDQLIVTGEGADPTGLYKVPAHWRGELNGTGLHGKGAASYRLILKVPPSDRIYGIRISNIQMSSALYVNGSKVGGSGVPALSIDAYKPENTPYVANFTIAGDQAEIIVQAANFHFIQGGIPYSIVFGSDSAIRALDKQATSIDVIVVIAILMLGIYHIGAYFGRKDVSLLYLSLYCVTAAVAFSSISGKLFMQAFGWLPFELSYKVQGGAIYLQIVMMLLFIKSMSSGLIPEKFIRVCSLVFLSGFVSILLLPHRIYSFYTFGFSALQVIVYFLLICMLSISYSNGRYGSFSKRTLLMTIMALCGLCAGLLDHTAYLLNLVPSGFTGIAGMMFFSITISLMLSLRYSEAFAVIESMSRKLQDADQAKDRFLVNTSHEFQTPLNGIINISSTMLEGGLGGINEKQQQSLSVILSVSRRLSALVNDLLDLEQIKRNELRLNLAAVDAGMIVSVVVDMFQYLIRGKKIRIACDIPDDLPPIYADEHRLTQIIYNLIGNAVKFVEQGDIIISARRSGDRVHVTVEDTGVGIVPNEWERIFTPFEQLSGMTASDYGGVGLGLSISRQLIERMNGTIRVEWSEPGKGTRIGFFLPAAKTEPDRTARSRTAAIPDAPRPPQDAPSAAEDESYTLLAVDDEPSNLQVLSDLFEGQGYRLLTATSGQEALQVIEAHREIDLVLLDVMMPKMSGFDVCRHLRGSYSLFDLPIIFLTARNAVYDLTAGFEAGANDYIAKPFDAREVRARVKTLLALKQSVHDALAAETAFLQSQIKPHFLFNALNSIISICYTDSVKAGQLISHLGKYLQSSFDIPGTSVFTSLREELKLVQAYVEIERARFEERLAVEYDIDDRLLDERFLPLTIQPLVENAIRHGVTKKLDGGLVKLTVRRHQDAIVVEVWDNGVGFPSEQLERIMKLDKRRKKLEPGGVGLANIQRRLLNSFRSGMQINSQAGEWTSVSFRVRVDDAGLTNFNGESEQRC